MNLLLIRPEEDLGSGGARINGWRRRHLVEVIGVKVGDSLRVGFPDGGTGVALVQEVSAEAVLLAHELDPAAPSADPAPLFDLLLALPRPKVLGRLLHDLAALGAGRIVICRSWRVEKSYFQTDLLAPAEMREILLRGLEQGVATRVPEVMIEPLFRPFVEDRLDEIAAPRRLLAHPGSAGRIGQVRLGPAERIMLAIGPEGGFIPFEVDLLASRGFEPIDLGPRILRVEAALLHALGALERSRS